MKPDKDILVKVKKLVAHERSARQIGSLAEANAFAEKIQSFCDQYRLTITDALTADSSEPRIETSQCDWKPEESGEKSQCRREHWITKMAWGIAQGHHCVALTYRGWSDCSFLGLKADAEVAREMMTVLVVSAMNALRERRKNGKVNKRDFLAGFADAIAHQYQQRRVRQVTEASTALMRLTDQLIKRELEDRKISKQAKLKGPHTGRDYANGVRAGMATSIDSQTLKASTEERKALLGI